MIGSPLIKASKKKETPTTVAADSVIASRGADPNAVTHEGDVVRNKDIRDASVADLFMGEYLTTFNHLDVAKIQMFLFTVLCVIAYTSAIAGLLRATQIPSSLPDVGDGLLPLLGISHAGYLMGKVAAAPSRE